MYYRPYVNYERAGATVQGEGCGKDTGRDGQGSMSKNVIIGAGFSGGLFKPSRICRRKKPFFRS